MDEVQIEPNEKQGGRLRLLKVTVFHTKVAEKAEGKGYEKIIGSKWTLTSMTTGSRLPTWQIMHERML